MSAVPKMLCVTGLLLFLLGLLEAYFIPVLASPRLGVSAHTTGMQAGVALIAVGLLWPQLPLWDGWSAPTGYGLWISLYVVFAGMTLGAIWATGRSLPIASGGVPAQAWQELVVRILLATGSIGTTAAIAVILVQWCWPRT